MRVRGKDFSIRTRERGPKDQRKWIRKLIPSGAEGGLYRPLQKNDLKRIHEASLHVLKNTGVEIEPSECRDICGRSFETIEEHTNFIRNGGCAKLMEVLANS